MLLCYAKELRKYVGITDYRTTGSSILGMTDACTCLQVSCIVFASKCGEKYNALLNTTCCADLRVCESTEALSEGLLVVESERAGEAAEVTCPLMEARAASRRTLSASRPSISESLAFTTLRISACRDALSRAACFCSCSVAIFWH